MWHNISSSDHCDNADSICVLYSVSNLTVLPSNIAIPTSQISENENGQLQIVFYVQIENNFLFEDQLQVAVQVLNMYPFYSNY